MPKTKMRWFSRFAVQTTARTVYRMLVDRNKRAVFATFQKRDDRILMLFARGVEKVELLRRAANLDRVEAFDTVPVPADGRVHEISENERGVLQMGARCALRTMKRNGRDVLVCEFSEPVLEPVLLLWARTDGVVDSILERAYANGLLDKPEQQAA